MSQQEACYRGIVLKESLVTGEMPPSLLPLIASSYSYMLDRIIPVTIIKLEIPLSQVNDIAWTLAGLLRNEKYFAQLTGCHEIIVVFPNALARVLKEVPETAEAARNIGTCFGIPHYQMQFEKMFESDHPNIM